jgi:AcrR family transcriptional regulator
MSNAPPASLHLRIPTDRQPEPRPRGRPPKSDYTPRPETELKRRQIRRTGAMLFAEQGVLEVSMSKIARRTRVNPNAMSYFYGTRQELLADIVAEHAYALNEAVCAAYDATSATDPRARLEAMLRAFLDTALADRHAHILSIHALCVLTERDREAVRLRWRILFETLADPLSALAPPLADEPRQGAMLAMAVVASVANVMLWFDEAEELDRGEHAARHAAMLVAGAKGGLAGTCEHLHMSCARAWLLLGDRSGESDGGATA